MLWMSITSKHWSAKGAWGAWYGGPALNDRHPTQDKLGYIVTFGISNTEFQNSKQSLMTDHLAIGNTKILKREEFTCILKQSLEKLCRTVLNQSGWSQSGVYNFDRTPVWYKHKLDIKVYAAALATSEPLTLTTESSVPLVELNLNSVDTLTTALSPELSRKRRPVDATSSA